MVQWLPRWMGCLGGGFGSGGSRRRRWGAVSLWPGSLSCVLALGSVALPAAAGGLLVVRVECPSGVDCLSRVEGQTVDLADIQLTRGTSQGPWDVQARLHSDPSGGAYAVIRFAGDREAYSEALGPPLGAGGADDSATVEAFALAVRMAVRALRARRASAPPAVAPSPITPSTPSALEVERRTSSDGPWLGLGIGAELAAPGFGFPNLTLVGGWRAASFGRLGLELGGAMAELKLSGVRAPPWLGRARLVWERPWSVTPQWALFGRVGMGVEARHRGSPAASLAAVPTRARAAFSLSPELGAGLSRRWSEHHAIALLATLATYLTPPEYQLADSSGQVVARLAFYRWHGGLRLLWTASF